MSADIRLACSPHRARRILAATIDRSKRGPGDPPKTLAVALRHAAGSDDTPRVVASGRGFTAERILEIAFANDVKVREDADLAEMLSAVGIGEEIPFAAFSAVAEILAHIYRANQAAASDAPVTPAATPAQDPSR